MKKALLWSGLIFLIGIILHDPIFSGIAAASFSLIYIYENYKKSKLRSINPLFMFVVASLIASIGNIIGFLSLGNENEERYFLYAIEEYLFESSAIHYFGLVLISLGYLFSSKYSIFPKIDMVRSNQRINKYLLLGAIAILFILYIGRLPALGTISTYIQYSPILIIFHLSRYGASYDSKTEKNYALLLTLLATVRAVFFEYLRLNMIIPVTAYAIGIALGKMETGVFLKPRFYLIYAFAFLFLNYFALFGEFRSEYITGYQRITRIAELDNEEKPNTFISRMSNFNQLTNVVSLVEKEGFYNGETLDYLGIAFIPRFLWPGKPTISKGSWFAVEIGQGYVNYEGRPNNSINMTVPGELYLNFGYLGLIFGCLIFGFIIAQFWNSTSFWEVDNNITGNFFGFYLLYIGLFSLGADLQVIVTVTAIYLITYLISKVFKFSNV